MLTRKDYLYSFVKKRVWGYLMRVGVRPTRTRESQIEVILTYVIDIYAFFHVKSELRALVRVAK